MSNVVRFPLERTRVPSRIEIEAEAGCLHELMQSASDMGGFLHYCQPRNFKRVIIKNGHACPVCGAQ